MARSRNQTTAPTRRRILKGAGVLAAGIVAPAILRVRTALAAYPERPVRIVVANTPGEYKVLALGATLDDMVDPALWLPPFIPFFPASFNDLRKVTVKTLGFDKQFTHADPLFETESHTFAITGAAGVTYSFSYKTPAPAPAGTVAGLAFTARPWPRRSPMCCR